MTQRLARSGPEVVVPPGALLGEGPRWDPVRRVLWWVDVSASVVHRYDPGTGTDHAHQLDISPSVLLPSVDGGAVLVAEQGLYSYRWQETPEPVLQVCPGPAEIRLNDAGCDGLGRLWVGSYHVDRVPGTGSWFVVDDDRPSAWFSGETLPNGVGVSPAGDVVYLVDSRLRRVDRVHLDPRDGTLLDRGPWLSLDDVGGVPDGLTVDADGDVWIGSYFGAAVRQYSAAGSLRRTIELPVGRVTSVAFGGDRLQDLFITTARGVSDDERSAEPLGGALFVLPDAGQGRETMPWDPTTAGPGPSG